MEKSDFTFDIMKGFDYVIEEKANSSINLRKIKWGDAGEYKVDIRKWMYKDGKEICGKGVSLSNDGANELALALCESGYGNTGDLIKSLKKRSDFDQIFSSEVGKNLPDDSDDEYYDPKQLLSYGA